MIEIKTFYRVVSIILGLFFMTSTSLILYELLYSGLQLSECYKVFIPAAFWSFLFLFVSITGKLPESLAFKFMKKNNERE